MKLGSQVLVTICVLAAAGAVWAALAPGGTWIRETLGLSRAAAPGTGASGATGEGLRTGGGAPGSGGPTVVIGGPVTIGRANGRVSAIGDARALRAVEVKPLASGRLVSLDATAGVEVRAGDVIARLDDDLEAIALESAQLAVEDAEATYERVAALRTRGAATDVQEREARLALDRARLEARNAALELDRRKVLAPIDGVLGLPPVERGAQVDPGTTIAAIEDRSSLLVEFRVPERVVGQIAPGDPVTASPLARPDLSLDGKISALDNRLDPASRTLLAQAALPNVDDRLRPGMAFAVEMRLPGEPFPEIDALAIQWGAEGAFVWVERDGRATRAPVRIVQRNAERVLVSGDLVPGERVVSEGVQRVREGAALRFVGDPPPADDGAAKDADDAAAPTAQGGPAEARPAGWTSDPPVEPRAAQGREG